MPFVQLAHHADQGARRAGFARTHGAADSHKGLYGTCVGASNALKGFRQAEGWVGWRKTRF